MDSAPPLLDVRDLTVSLDLGETSGTAVDGIGFTLPAGEILGMVGESGSGKSMTALAINRMLPGVASITGGQVLLRGTDLSQADETAMRRIRGRDIGMIFQDPLASLNPLMTVGAQITEALRLHGTPHAAARRRAVELLRLVGIADARRAVDDRPHQFSGGMRQRVMIAMAVANDPALLIADEPTTALDVTVQAEVLGLLARLRDELGTAILLITHDIGVVEEVCDRMVVLYAGRIAERGRVGELLAAPRHPYTFGLMRSVPRIDRPSGVRLPAIPGRPPDLAALGTGCRFADRCDLVEDRCRREQPPLAAAGSGEEHLAACWVVNERGETLRAAEPAAAEPRTPVSPAGGEPIVVVEDVVVDYRARGRRRLQRPAVDGVSLQASAGHTIGLVGESGCGKTTLSRAMVGLLPVSSGQVTVEGHAWRSADREQTVRMRRAVQLVFQDPYASLNPRWRVRQIVAEGMNGERRDSGELMELVGLPRAFLDRYPDELSGGQRQRVGIARALAAGPDLLIADEPVSALDVSVQAQVINLLGDLRDRLGLGLVFVAHDLAVVRHVSDELAVMYRGRIIEQGPAEEVFDAPLHPYTRRLIASAPGQGGPARSPGNLVDGAEVPATGCRFRDRCPIGPLADPGRTICEERDPLLPATGGHRAACHFPGEAAPGHLGEATLGPEPAP